MATKEESKMEEKEYEVEQEEEENNTEKEKYNAEELVCCKDQFCFEKANVADKVDKIKKDESFCKKLNKLRNRKEEELEKQHEEKMEIVEELIENRLSKIKEKEKAKLNSDEVFIEIDDETAKSLENNGKIKPKKPRLFEGMKSDKQLEKEELKKYEGLPIEKKPIKIEVKRCEEKEEKIIDIIPGEEYPEIDFKHIDDFPRRVYIQNPDDTLTLVTTKEFTDAQINSTPLDKNKLKQNINKIITNITCEFPKEKLVPFVFNKKEDQEEENNEEIEDENNEEEQVNNEEEENDLKNILKKLYDENDLMEIAKILRDNPDQYDELMSYLKSLDPKNKQKLKEINKNLNNLKKIKENQEKFQKDTEEKNNNNNLDFEDQKLKCKYKESLPSKAPGDEYIYSINKGQVFPSIVPYIKKTKKNRYTDMYSSLKNTTIQNQEPIKFENLESSIPVKQEAKKESKNEFKIKSGVNPFSGERKPSKNFSKKLSKDNIKNKATNKAKLSEEEIESLVNDYMSKIYTPLESKSKNKKSSLVSEKDNENKLKEVSEDILNLNLEDQKKVLNLLKNTANTDEQKENFKKVDSFIKSYNKPKKTNKKI